jgi:hypothetical protein
LLLVCVWCISFASLVLCKGSNEMEIIGLHSANRPVIGCSTMAGRLLTSSPTFPVLCAVVSISLDPLWRARMANCLQQMLLQSQLSQTGYRHLALISCMLGCKPRYPDGTYLNVNVTLWRCEFHLWLVLYSTMGSELRK